jgi:hypothetical protein
MRQLLAAGLLAIALATPAAAETSQGPWTSAYDAATGMTTATQREPGGDVTAAFACRAPDGELMVYDYRVGGGSSMTLSANGFSQRADARRERGPDGRALTARFKQSPPIIGVAAYPDMPLTIEAGGRSHTLARGAGMKLLEVANACWVR